MSVGDESGLRRFEQSLDNMRVYVRGIEANPHKFLLLLSVTELLRLNEGHPNRFTFQELEPIFEAEFQDHFPKWPPDRRTLDSPFYHLQSEDYWHLKLKEGQETTYQQYQKTRLTRNRLIETVAYAYFDEDLFRIMRVSDSRKLIESKLGERVTETSADVTDASGPSVSEESGGYTTSVQPVNSELALSSGGESNNTLDGGSLFAHEQSAIHLLREGIGLNCLGALLSNIQLYDRESNGYYESDVIVIAHTGIYVVELKHWSGRIRVAPNNWLIDQYRYRRDPHIANGFKCKLLKGLYEHRFPTYPNLWVESVVVLTNLDANVDGAVSPSEAAAAARSRHNPTFASIDDFRSYLRKLAGFSGNQVLGNTEIDSISPPSFRRKSLPSAATHTLCLVTRRSST